MMDHTYSVADQETDQPVYTLTTEKEKEPLSSTERKICGRGKLYCAICSNCEGKELDDGRILKMHRIPAEPDPSKTDEKSMRRRKQRKLWIQRIKTVRVDFNLTSSARICSEHFAEGVYKGTVDEIPVRLHLEKPVKKPKVRHSMNGSCVCGGEGGHGGTYTMTDTSDNPAMSIECHCNVM